MASPERSLEMGTSSICLCGLKVSSGDRRMKQRPREVCVSSVIGGWKEMEFLS